MVEPTICGLAIIELRLFRLESEQGLISGVVGGFAAGTPHL
jgi:hypothetical protein